MTGLRQFFLGFDKGRGYGNYGDGSFISHLNGIKTGRDLNARVLAGKKSNEQFLKLLILSLQNGNAIDAVQCRSAKREGTTIPWYCHSYFPDEYPKNY